MSADATTARSGLPPFYRRRRFLRTALPVTAMVVAFLVGLGLYNAFYGSSGLHENQIPLTQNPPTPPPDPPTTRSGSNSQPPSPRHNPDARNYRSPPPHDPTPTNASPSATPNTHHRQERGFAYRHSNSFNRLQVSGRHALTQQRHKASRRKRGVTGLRADEDSRPGMAIRPYRGRSLRETYPARPR